MRRHFSGVGCGACGRGRTYPRSREAPGRRPSLLWGTAFNGWTRRGRRRAKARRIGLSPKPPGSAPGSYGPGDRKAAMERRVASVLRKGRHAARRRTDGCATRRSIPSAFCRGLEGNYGAPRAAQIIGARKRARLEQGRWRACALNAAASRPHRLRAVQAARSSPRAWPRSPASPLRSDSKWSCWSRAARRR